MTPLTLAEARSFEVPCRWTGASGVLPDAMLTISGGPDGWSVCVLPGPNWAPLWLTDTHASPWGRWRAHYGIYATFSSADNALIAALGTPQIASQVAHPVGPGLIVGSKADETRSGSSPDVPVSEFDEPHKFYAAPSPA